MINHPKRERELTELHDYLSVTMHWIFKLNTTVELCGNVGNLTQGHFKFGCWRRLELDFRIRYWIVWLILNVQFETSR